MRDYSRTVQELRVTAVERCKGRLAKAVPKTEYSPVTGSLKKKWI
jgi:hypothetical protein